jgi:hypothetical protein
MIRRAVSQQPDAPYLVVERTYASTGGRTELPGTVPAEIRSSIGGCICTCSRSRQQSHVVVFVEIRREFGLQVCGERIGVDTVHAGPG